MKNETAYLSRMIMRGSVLQNLLKSKISAAVAARQLKISRRQVLRLKKRYKKLGIDGLRHQGFGRKAPNKSDEKIENLIIDVFEDWREKTDPGINCSHLADVLKKDHKILISRQTVWRVLRRNAKKMQERKSRKHRIKRERARSEGQILFLDGSPHPWFGEDRPKATLLLCTDDATGKALYGIFARQECLMGCLEVAYNVFTKFGLPTAFYLDRASQFKTTRKKYLYSEMLPPPTAWQQCMERLAIRCIFASSPQARGRGERINGSFQGRLAAELQFNNIKTLGAGTRYMNETFIPQYNQRFAVAAAEAPIWRTIPQYIDLNFALGVTEERLVHNDNTFHYCKGHYQILAHKKAYTLAGKTIVASQGYDGSVAAMHPTFGSLEIRTITPAKVIGAKSGRVTFKLQQTCDI
jgi:transposase